MCFLSVPDRKHCGSISSFTISISALTVEKQKPRVPRASFFFKVESFKEMSFAWVSIPPTFPTTETRNAVQQRRSSFYSSSVRNISVSRRSNGIMPYPSREAPQMSTPDNDTFQLPVQSVIDEENMLCPGEIRDVALDYFFFHSILNEGGTLYGVVHADEWSPSGEQSTRGVVLTVLSIENLLQNNRAETSGEGADSLPPRILVGCRCSGRFDVQRIVDGVLAEDSGPDSNVYSHVNAICTPVRDCELNSFADRRKVAYLEWDAWNACREVSALIRKLASPKGDALLIEQELSVWSPASYDRDITEDEWAKTPHGIREVWFQRAESFSFGVLRCMESGKEVMRKARLTTNTMERLEMAINVAEERKAYVSVQLSLKDTLG